MPYTHHRDDSGLLVVRYGPDHYKYGDPYTAVCYGRTERFDPGHIQLYAAAGTVGTKAVLDLFSYLNELGYVKVSWLRIKKHKTYKRFKLFQPYRL